MYHLGNCYRKGKHVVKDTSKAIQYYISAAEAGLVHALYMCAWVHVRACTRTRTLACVDAWTKKLGRD